MSSYQESSQLLFKKSIKLLAGQKKIDVNIADLQETIFVQHTGGNDTGSVAQTSWPDVLLD
jgi:hypothetical protein